MIGGEKNNPLCLLINLLTDCRKAYHLLSEHIDTGEDIYKITCCKIFITNLDNIIKSDANFYSIRRYVISLINRYVEYIGDLITAYNEDKQRKIFIQGKMFTIHVLDLIYILLETKEAF